MEYGGDFAFSGIAYRLFHSLIDVEPLNPFTLDMDARKPYHIRRTVRAVVLYPAPRFVAIFP
jgi:hypothetical protein